MSIYNEQYAEDKLAAEAVAAAKRQLAEAAAEEEQLNLLDPLTADEIEDAKSALGPGAGMVTVLREARKAKGGRPPGKRNRRTEEFVRYIGQFGQDPAITLMQIQATAPEELVARSRLIDGAKRQMSYIEAQSLRVRCAEALMPFLHSKQPVAVDATIRGVMVVEEIGGARGPMVELMAEPIGVAIEDAEFDE